MDRREVLNNILRKTSEELHDTFGQKLDSVILYGSYARGDYDDESDIDVMALVDMDKSELSKYRRKISSFAGDMDMKYDVLLSIKLQDKKTFDEYKTALPYYMNVLKDGVKINV